MVAFSQLLRVISFASLAVAATAAPLEATQAPRLSAGDTASAPSSFVTSRKAREIYATTKSLASAASAASVASVASVASAASAASVAATAVPSGAACGADSTIANGTCTKCTSLWSGSSTCTPIQPTSCQRGYKLYQRFHKETGLVNEGCERLPDEPCPNANEYRVDLDNCAPCASKFPHSVTCTPQSVVTCEDGYKPAQYIQIGWGPWAIPHSPKACELA